MRRLKPGSPWFIGARRRAVRPSSKRAGMPVSRVGWRLVDAGDAAGREPYSRSPLFNCGSTRLT